MKAGQALPHLRDFARRKGVAIDDLSSTEAIQLMLDFYCDVSADDCEVEKDGDMLLFQWGVYDWGNGEFFEYDITRQLIREPYDDHIWQLSLTLKYHPVETLRELKAGYRWCERPENLDGFRRFIRECEATRFVQEEEPIEVELYFQDVE